MILHFPLFLYQMLLLLHSHLLRVVTSLHKVAKNGLFCKSYCLLGKRDKTVETVTDVLTQNTQEELLREVHLRLNTQK